MQCYRSLITIILVSSLLLGPVKAGILAWLAENIWFLRPLRLLTGYNRENNFGTQNSFNNIGNGDMNFSGGTVISSGGIYGANGRIPPFPKGIVVQGPTVFRNGKIESGAMESNNYGSVYKVRIRQYRGKNGECEEEIMMLWLEKPTGKTIYAKCKYGVLKRIKVKDSLLLLGSPNENFCAFTTNKNEIYYLDNGKWKKGAFDEDNKKDKELTASEISRIKQRINKWEEFLVKHKTEVDRLRGLKDVKRQTRNKRKEELRGLRNKERENHRGINEKIRQLRNDEREKHRVKTQYNNDIRRKEGSSEKVNNLVSEELRRHNAEEARLNKMLNDENQRHNNEDNRYDKLIDKEDSICETEIQKLDNLIYKDDVEASTELKQMISQGW